MKQVTIQSEINKPINQVWDFFNNPKHIVNWNFAQESWECPIAKNNLEVGGKLEVRMQAKDGSFGFDLVGIYDEVRENELIKYHFEDGRNIEVIFEKLSDDKTGLVFILWGAYAQSKSVLINPNNNHLIIKSTHPSPLAVSHGGFFGSKPFSKTNDFLKKQGKEPIDWQID